MRRVASRRRAVWNAPANGNRAYALHRIERLLTIDRYRVTIAAQPLLPFYAAAAPLTIGLKATDADRAPLSKREHTEEDGNGKRKERRATQRRALWKRRGT